MWVWITFQEDIWKPFKQIVRFEEYCNQLLQKQKTKKIDMFQYIA